MKPAKIRIPIFAKLIGIILFLLLGAVLGLEQVSTRLYTEDSTGLIQQMNVDAVTSVAARTRALFESVTEKSRILGAILLWESQSRPASSLAKKLLEKDPDITALFLVEHHHSSSTQPKVIHAAFAKEIQLGEKFNSLGLELFPLEEEFSSQAMGSIQVVRTQTPDSRPALALSVPLMEAANSAEKSYSLLTIAPLARFQQILDSGGASLVYVVDKMGKAILHPDLSVTATGTNLSTHPLVAQLLEGKTSNGLSRYPAPISKQFFLGAFRTVGFGGLGAISEIPESKALAPAARVEYRALLLSVIVVSLGTLIGFWFSESLSARLRKLVNATLEVSRGNFQTRVQSRSRDELQTLAEAFNEMTAGLEERERVKNVFHKFHSKEVADKLLSSDVKLGGERRNAIIFFNDIRQFTSLAETLKPEAVIEFLNEYMTRMVGIIRKHGGVVDKYMGDAIMAIWGFPDSKSTDAYQAIFAALQMRLELNRMNKERIAKGLPALRIGTGINYGPVIAGNIGSSERMEYTVIGDSVNLAARLESLTKDVGTDLLISKSVLDLTGKAFYVESCGALPVKGKQKGVEVYRVLGYYGKDQKVTLVQTPYSDNPVPGSSENPNAA